jgi:lantibiotic modifying enzyme
VLAWRFPEITPDDLWNSAKELTSPGWCDGRAGLAALALMMYRDTGERECLDIALEMTSIGVREAANADGLCHGRMGVLAVAAGAARAGDESSLARMVTESAEESCWRAETEGWSLEGGAVGHGWLTGIAGIAWGLLAVANQPRVNPLSPADASAWASGR